jgi:hypothetical protein
MVGGFKSRGGNVSAVIPKRFNLAGGKPFNAINSMGSVVATEIVGLDSKSK